MMLRKSIPIEGEYFLWLYDHIKSKKHDYLKLCEILFHTEFKWYVHNDDNRCQDGTNLRDVFFEEKHLDESHLEVRSLLKKRCSVFEVLVALALRMNELMYDLDNQRDQTPKWFHEMLTNLGLNIYVDGFNFGRRFDEMTELRIDDILTTLMDRTYDSYGRGGLFPLKRAPRNHQADVEIWYQMMAYMDENYGG
jgi:hypothetical protein